MARTAAEQAVYARARAVANGCVAMQAAWPGSLELCVPPADPLVAIAPWWFGGSAPEEERIAAAVLCSLVRVVVDAATGAATVAPLRLLAVHAEIASRLGRFAGAADPAGFFKAGCADLAFAETERTAYRSRRRALADCDDAAIAESAHARALAERLALRLAAGSGGFEPTAEDALQRALRAFVESRAALGALASWRGDVAQTEPTHVTTRLARASADGPQRALVEVVELATARARTALKALSEVSPAPAFRQIVERHASRLHALTSVTPEPVGAASGR